MNLDLHLDYRDAGFPVANRVDCFAHQVWRDAVGGPVEVQVQVAAKFWPMRVAAFRGDQDDADGLVDVAQALDHFAGGTECGLPVGGGDAAEKNVRCHGSMVRTSSTLSF